MKDNETTAKGILVIVIYLVGLLSGWFIWPEVRTVEKVVEVEKIVKEATTEQDIYSFCASEARIALYSSWDGDPKEGTTPKNTQDFIDDCFSKLTPQK